MKYLKHFELFESISSYDIKPMNDCLKLIGLSINKMAPFQPSANKIKKGITTKHRYKIGYNFMKTIFKNVIICIYGSEFNIKKLRWIFIDHPSFLGKKRTGGASIYLHVMPHIYLQELLDEVIENIMISDISISYDTSNGVHFDLENSTNTSKQIQDKLFLNILKNCILHYKENLSLDKNDVCKIIATYISNLDNNYSIINSFKKDRFLWKKLAPYFNGANDASVMGGMGFSD